MVVIKTEEEFWSFVEMSYTPYLMRSQNRWYMRRGQKRHTIARGLDEFASRVAGKAGVKHGKPIKAGVIQEMRLKGAPVEDIVEETDLSRSAVYCAFERDLKSW